MLRLELALATAILATGVTFAQTPSSNTNPGGSSGSTSVATQPNNNDNPVNRGNAQAGQSADNQNANNNNAQPSNNNGNAQGARSGGQGDELVGKRTSGANANDPAAKQSAASSQSNLGTADPNDTRAQTDANGNPIAAQHTTRGNTWMWTILGVIVLAFIVRYIARGRAPAGEVTNIDRDRNRRDDDIRRAG